MPEITRLKELSAFPASVLGGDGIVINKAGAVYTISADPSLLTDAQAAAAAAEASAVEAAAAAAALTGDEVTVTGDWTFATPPTVTTFTQGKLYSDSSGAIKSAISNFVHPTEYGTSGTEAALVAALASGHHVDGGGEAYTITATLHLATYQKLINCNMIKGANCDLVDMSTEGCELTNCIVSGQGGTYTGRGIVISAHSVQKITNVIMDDMNGYCLEFTTTDAGDSVEVNSCQFTRTVSTNKAIKFGIDSGLQGRRWFNNVRGRGAHLYDLSGAKYIIIRGGDSTGITFDSDTNSCVIENHRLATTAFTVKGQSVLLTHIYTPATITVEGNGHCLDNCEHQGGSIVIDAGATGCTILARDAVVTDNSNGANFIVANDRIIAPSSPGFLAYNSVTDSNVTGDGTAVTVDFDTEVKDRGTNFAADTFTAPLAGLYEFSASVYLDGLTSGTHSVLLSLVTSNRTYLLQFATASRADQVFSGTVLAADMDAGDTASVSLTVSDGAKTVDVVGAITPTNIGTYFMGRMM